jgi:hypothetical protein
VLRCSHLGDRCLLSSQSRSYVKSKNVFYQRAADPPGVGCEDVNEREPRDETSSVHEARLAPGPEVVK